MLPIYVAKRPVIAIIHFIRNCLPLCCWSLFQLCDHDVPLTRVQLKLGIQSTIVSIIRLTSMCLEQDLIRLFKNSFCSIKEFFLSLSLIFFLCLSFILCFLMSQARIANLKSELCFRAWRALLKCSR